MEQQLKVFQENLTTFAHKYKKQINSNPAFRAKFHEMCTTIGVDPLQSTKGFWSELLGFGSFYYELAVQLVELCYLTRPSNGGLLALSDATEALTERRSRVSSASSRKGSSAQQISEDDVERAVDVLRKLGNGFKLLEIGRRKMIRSVPAELDKDQETALQLGQSSGFITSRQLQTELGWTAERTSKCIHHLMSSGIAWIDKAPDGEASFYFPCFCFV